MNKRVAILTPDASADAHHTRWRDVFEAYSAPLSAAGFSPEPRDWSNADDLADFSLVLPLLVWGYPFAPEHWRQRLDQWDRQDVRLQNPASVLRWNADKNYLSALDARGAPVIPTRFVDRVTVEAMEEAAAAFGADRVVAKPRISSTAWRTIRWSRGDGIEDGPEGAALIQPYLPEIEISGELSLIFFGGAFSHAISKRPQPGDFRVQPEFDGIIRAHDPAQAELAAAERVLAAVDEDLLYARVDLVRGLDGEPQLIELELIEPDLYLRHDPTNGAAFASAIAELIPG